MVSFANTTRHDLLSFQLVHWVLVLVLRIEVLFGGIEPVQVSGSNRSSSPVTGEVISHLFAGNEGHEDVVADGGGGNVGTRCVKLRVAKFLPVLKKKKKPPNF